LLKCYSSSCKYLLIGTLSEPPWFSASSQLPKTGIHFCLTVDTGYSGNIEHLIATYKMRQHILNCYWTVRFHQDLALSSDVQWLYTSLGATDASMASWSIDSSPCLKLNISKIRFYSRWTLDNRSLWGWHGYCFTQTSQLKGGCAKATNVYSKTFIFPLEVPNLSKSQNQLTGCQS
jgi:hypothetical protein